MSMRKKILVSIVVAVALTGVGAGVVLAGSSDDDRPLRGTTYERATEAALDHVGGGTVVETEAGDDGAAYSVEIRRDDGTVVEVNLDGDYNVIGSEKDDEDSPNEEDDSDDEGAEDDD